jgi:hypothetical protein
MLSLFPEILFLAPLGTTFLRVAVGILFISMAWQMYRESRRMADVQLPLIGQLHEFLIMLWAGFIGVVGLALVVGVMTQIAALAGMLILIKRTVLRRYFEHICPFIFTIVAFAFLICFMLLVTGPGAFAFDLPL